MPDKKTTDKIKDIAKSVSDAAKPYASKAEPYIEMAKEKATPVIEEFKEMGAPVLDNVMEKAAPVLDEVKKRTAPATKVVKEQSAKAADAVKAVSKDISETTAKKNTKTQFFIQYKDYEVRTEDIADRIREQYIAQGHKAADISELQIYLKPEENTAYYVINHKETGKFTY